MKEVLKQSNADWEVTLKVTDREAKKRKAKSVIYDYKAEIQTDGISYEIYRALEQAKLQAVNWKN